MLAISKHGTEIRARLRDLRQQYQDDDQKQVSFIANYLQEKFGFIADVKTIDNLFVKTATVQPQENFINTSHCNINTPKRLTRNRKNEGE
jgi:primosomal protein N''